VEEFGVMQELLTVKNLETHFHTRDGVVHAVNGISFGVNEGETLGIVGESGCGKSVSVMSILRLVPTPPGKIVGGEAIYQGNDLLKMNEDKLREVRGSQIGVVFQDPMTSFNPVISIGLQIAEVLETHKNLSRSEANKRSADMLTLVGIPNAKDRLKDYPHQFSGGMRQRVMIAMALVCSPQLLIADEPTTALDVTIQAQIVDLVKKLRDELNMAIIWISHDMGVVAELADRVNVMYAGYVIETAPVHDLYKEPAHPYTLGLLGSLPRIDEHGEHRRLTSIEGLPPILMEKPTFCPFYSRCQFAIEHCNSENPALIPIKEGHRVACWVDTQTRKERA
jgi:oligopeptide transport system ATP-binding protein